VFACSHCQAGCLFWYFGAVNGQWFKQKVLACAFLCLSFFPKASSFTSVCLSALKFRCFSFPSKYKGMQAPSLPVQKLLLLVLFSRLPSCSQVKRTRSHNWSFDAKNRLWWYLRAEPYLKLSKEHTLLPALSCCFHWTRSHTRHFDVQDRLWWYLRAELFSSCLKSSRSCLHLLAAFTEHAVTPDALTCKIGCGGTFVLNFFQVCLKSSRSCLHLFAAFTEHAVSDPTL